MEVTTYALMRFQNKKKVFSSQMSSEKFKDQKSKGQERFTRVFLRVY